MTATIRKAQQEDAALIWGFVQELAEFEKLSHELQGSLELVEKWVFDRPVASVLLAEYEGNVVGYALFFPTLATFRMKPGMWLEDLFVRSEYRGKGIGKALIEAVIQEARDQDFARVDWSVLDWNEHAIHFYRNLGAEILPEWRICRYSL